MSSQHTGIFVATMTGLASMCAEEIETALAAEGHASQILLMDGLAADALAPFETIVIVSSTYGHGDIPDNGKTFFEALEGIDSLAGKSFTVFALGDRTYMDTFCHAGEKWDALLTAKGATCFAPIERHDASSGTLAEDEAGGWTAGWAPKLKMAA